MEQPPVGNRLASLDQFRGYTVLGMFVVNFLGGYACIPAVFHHHHTYCSYADTIMPQFLFAVGFAMRISFVNRLSREGAPAAYRHFATRSLGLILLGIVVYHLTGKYESWSALTDASWRDVTINLFKRGPFETLTHIGVTTLWVLPVIARSARVRLAFAFFSGLLHIGLSLWFYYDWNMTGPVGIDGGPLGFLTWTIPLVAGTVTRDLFLLSRRPKKWLLLGSIPLMALAIVLSLALNESARIPFFNLEGDIVRNYWLMSQRAGSVTYLLFSTGFAMVVFVAFAVVCDSWGRSWELFGLLGRNALAAYLVHDLVGEAVKPFLPKDSPLTWTLAMLSIYLGVTILFMRYLDRHRLWLRL